MKPASNSRAAACSTALPQAPGEATWELTSWDMVPSGKNLLRLCIASSAGCNGLTTSAGPRANIFSNLEWMQISFSFALTLVRFSSWISVATTDLDPCPHRKPDCPLPFPRCKRTVSECPVHTFRVSARPADSSTTRFSPDLRRIKIERRKSSGARRGSPADRQNPN